MKFIPYGRQIINSKDKKLVLNSLSKDLITTGPYVTKFQNNIKKYHHIFSKLSYLSEKYSVSYSQLSLRWVLEKEHVTSTICGIKSEKQLLDSSSCLNWKIEDEDLNFFYREFPL